MTNITVLDAIMGSGKTTYLIKMVNDAALEDARRIHRRRIEEDYDELTDDQTRRFIYIGMYLDEAERIREACPRLDFVTPKAIDGRKLSHFNQLIAAGQNIAATHALFQNINADTFELLQEFNYTLVIDETLECVTEFGDLSKDDIRTLFESEHVFVDDKKRMRWNHERWPVYDGKFNRVRDLCDNENLVFLEGRILLWELPTKFLGLFSDVFIGTYLFEGSLMANYLKANGVRYRMASVSQRCGMVPYGAVPEGEIKARLRELITVVDDARLNAVGTKNGKGNPMSATWFEYQTKNKGPAIKKLQANAYTFFRKHAETPSHLNMWTTYKRAKKHLAGDGYSRGFVPINAKATNDYINKASLAYLANIFLFPPIKRYFAENGIEAREDLFSLSELVQWIWRSRIREGKPITLYIPSERMRGLFLRWLHADSVVELKEAA
jgi:hypothetical protein